MRLDAMCCEVSLSHWIAPGRLTVAPRYQRLCVGKAAAEGAGRGRTRKALYFASSPLLVPAGFEALVTFDWQLQLLVWRGCGISYANDWSDAGINPVNKRLGRSYRTAIKMHLFDWDLGLCKETRNSPWAALYNRIVAGWKLPNSDAGLIWLYKFLWPLKSCIYTCSEVCSSLPCPSLQQCLVSLFSSAPLVPAAAPVTREVDVALV